MEITDLSNFTELNFNSAKQIEGQSSFSPAFDDLSIDSSVELETKFDPEFNPNLGCPWCYSGCDIRLNVEFQELELTQKPG